MKYLVLVLFILVNSFAEQRGSSPKIVLSNNEKIEKKLFGNYKALIIGNEKYKYLDDLKTPLNDVKQLKEILQNKYGFEVETLKNKNRSQIVSKLHEYAKKLKKDDNFLLFYAGHGYYDEESEESYWLPVDSKEEDIANWINSATITSQLKKAYAKHILVIADSCYSGTLTRSRDINKPKISKYIKRAISKKSRTLLASGGNEPVSDGFKNSVFAKPLIQELKTNDSSVILADELFINIREVVAGNSEQKPEYKIIRNSGHKGGSFIFVNNEKIKDKKTKYIFEDEKIDKYTLTVNTTPQDAKVQILNIKPKYHEEILLKAGIYKLHISKKGYLTKQGEIDLQSNLNIDIELTKEKTQFFQTPKDKGTYIEPAMAKISSKNQSFLMGSKYGASDEKDIKRVTFDYDYYMGKYEVTNKEYVRFLNNTSNIKRNWFEDKSRDRYSRIIKDKNKYKVEKGYENHPGIISWYGAKAYAKWLSEKTNKKYRLPTESEWEYAARAKTKTKYFFGDNDKDLGKYAWYHKNHINSTHPVGLKKPNPFGLYDIYGNEFEWCEDWYVKSYKNTPKDGSANSSGEKKYKVLRGGSWLNNANFLRSVVRFRSVPSDTVSVNGFRLVALP